MKRHLLTLLCWAVSASAAWIFPGVAAAQDSQGASVVVLKFEANDVPEDTMRTVYGAIGQAIERHPEMYVKPGGEVTIQDLALTAGCDSPDVDCLSGLRSLVGADRVVFGTVRGRADGYTLSMKMFDFAEGRFIHEASGLAVREEAEREALPAAGEAFVYGDTGVVQVNVTGGEEAQILFDGRPVGVAPARVEELPLGEHIIAVRSASGEEKSERIILRHEQPDQVSFTFDDDAGDLREPVAVGDAPSTTTAWMAIGVGALGAGVGVWGLIEEADAAETIDEICTPQSECQGLAARLDDLDAQRAYVDARDQGSRGLTMQLIGFTTAGVGLITGGVLLYRAYNQESAPAQATGLDWQINPSSDGVRGSVRLSF